MIERDVAELDEFGGETKAKREVIGTIPARYWWWRVGGSRGGAKEYATSTRTVESLGGAMIVPLGSDIKEGYDHVAEIQDEDGKVLFEGPFRVVGVEEYESHLNVALVRP